MAKHWKKRRKLPLMRYRIARKMTERWYREASDVWREIGRWLYDNYNRDVAEEA